MSAATTETLERLVGSHNGCSPAPSVDVRDDRHADQYLQAELVGERAVEQSLASVEAPRSVRLSAISAAASSLRTLTNGLLDESIASVYQLAAAGGLSPDAAPADVPSAAAPPKYLSASVDGSPHRALPSSDPRARPEHSAIAALSALGSHDGSALSVNTSVSTGVLPAGLGASSAARTVLLFSTAPAAPVPTPSTSSGSSGRLADGAVAADGTAGIWRATWRASDASSPASAVLSARPASVHTAPPLPVSLPLSAASAPPAASSTAAAVGLAGISPRGVISTSTAAAGSGLAPASAAATATGVTPLPMPIATFGSATDRLQQPSPTPLAAGDSVDARVSRRWHASASPAMAATSATPSDADVSNGLGSRHQRSVSAAALASASSAARGRALVGSVVGRGTGTLERPGARDSSSMVLGPSSSATPAAAQRSPLSSSVARGSALAAGSGSDRQELEPPAPADAATSREAQFATAAQQAHLRALGMRAASASTVIRASFDSAMETLQGVAARARLLQQQIAAEGGTDAAVAGSGMPKRDSAATSANSSLSVPSLRHAPVQASLDSSSGSLMHSISTSARAALHPQANAEKRAAAMRDAVAAAVQRGRESVGGAAASTDGHSAVHHSFANTASSSSTTADFGASALLCSSQRERSPAPSSTAFRDRNSAAVRRGGRGAPLHEAGATPASRALLARLDASASFASAQSSRRRSLSATSALRLLFGAHAALAGRLSGHHVDGDDDNGADHDDTRQEISSADVSAWLQDVTGATHVSASTDADTTPVGHAHENASIRASRISAAGASSSALAYHASRLTSAAVTAAADASISAGVGAGAGAGVGRPAVDEASISHASGAEASSGSYYRRALEEVRLARERIQRAMSTQRGGAGGGRSLPAADTRSGGTDGTGRSVADVGAAADPRGNASGRAEAAAALDLDAGTKVARSVSATGPASHAVVPSNETTTAGEPAAPSAPVSTAQLVQAQPRIDPAAALAELRLLRQRLAPALASARSLATHPAALLRKSDTTREERSESVAAATAAGSSRDDATNTEVLLRQPPAASYHDGFQQLRPGSQTRAASARSADTGRSPNTSGRQPPSLGGEAGSQRALGEESAPSRLPPTVVSELHSPAAAAGAASRAAQAPASPTADASHASDRSLSSSRLLSRSLLSATRGDAASLRHTAASAAAAATETTATVPTEAAVGSARTASSAALHSVSARSAGSVLAGGSQHGDGDGAQGGVPEQVRHQQQQQQQPSPQLFMRLQLTEDTLGRLMEEVAELRASRAVQ